MEKRTYSLPRITLTNLNVFLLFLAHIIPMTCFTKNMYNFAFKINLSPGSVDVIMTSSKIPLTKTKRKKLTIFRIVTYNTCSRIGDI